MERMPEYLNAIGRPELLETLSKREEWNILAAVSPQERALLSSGPMPMSEFAKRVWSAGFGGGDPFATLPRPSIAR